MKEIKSSKSLTRQFFNSKARIIGASAIAAVIIIIIAVFMIIEGSYGKWSIKNKTELKLDYVNTEFVNPEGYVADGIETESIAAGKTYTTDLEKTNLLYTESNIEVRFKFENSEEMFTDVGYFIDNFDGNVTISFQPTDDPNLITLKVKASNGIFQTKTVDCNEEYTINLSESKIYE